MATGFCPSLLYHINEIAGENAPGRKMHVAGFLAMLFCCQNSSVSPINDSYANGHQRGLNIKYRRRPVLADVQTEDNCDINTQPGYLEWAIPTLLHRQTSFHIADDLISRYCEDASRMRATGQPPTQVMMEVYDLIVEHANILMRAINRAVVTAQATEFGVNVSTGSDTGKVINIPRNGNDFVLDNGIVDMMQDVLENEICGEPCLVGGGIYSAYNQARAIACCNAAGLDLSRTGVPNFFFDKDTQQIWGANSVGLFAPGSVKFISRNKYVRGFAGQKGTSFFTTLPLPVNEFGCADECLRDLVLDMQLKYFDCPTDDGNGGTIERGWQVILSKDFALWTQPNDAFAATDELYQTNGTLKYFVGNSSYGGDSYAYPA
jgi:hypothetical protein